MSVWRGERRCGFAFVSDQVRAEDRRRPVTHCLITSGNGFTLDWVETQVPVCMQLLVAADNWIGTVWPSGLMHSRNHNDFSDSCT